MSYFTRRLRNNPRANGIWNNYKMKWGAFPKHNSRHRFSQMKFFSKSSRGNSRRETGYLGSTGGRIKFN